MKTASEMKDTLAGIDLIGGKSSALKHTAIKILLNETHRERKNVYNFYMVSVS